MPPAARIPLSLWEREKEHIRALYLDQDKTLDELVKCMAEEHGFEATRAQYIRRLDSWKMRKYSTKEEWEYVHSLVRKRKLEGKESEIIMDGKPISVKKLKKELGRYGQPSSSEKPCSSLPEDALEGIVACTPPTTTSVSFQINMIRWATVPWFLFHDSFVPSDLCLSMAAKTVAEELPKRPDVDAPQAQSSAPSHFIQLLCWAIYQSSNNLLSDDQTDHFLNWLISHGYIRFLQQSTPRSDLVMRVLMTNLLLSAIRLRNPKIVGFLLDNGADPNVTHRDSRETALQLAVKDKLSNTEIVEMLLGHGACPNTVSPESTERRSPLLLAMVDLPWKSSIAKRLILAGANVNVTYPLSPWEYRWESKTPLMFAVQKDTSLIHLLLDKGADPNFFPPAYGSALHAAVRTSSVDFVRALLKAGADANIPYGDRDQSSFNDLLTYLAREKPLRVLKSLLTPVDIAYQDGNGLMIDLLLQAGAHADGCAAFIDRLDPKIGTIALKEAKIAENHRLVKSLLEAGVRRDRGTSISASACNSSALQNALLPRNFSSAMKPLDLGAKTNPTSSHQGKSSIFQTAPLVIIESNAHTHQGRPKLSSLSWSILRQDHELFEQLISEGAKPDSPQDWPTPLCDAINVGSLIMVRRLIEAGANVNRPSWLPGVNNPSILRTPLQIAIQKGDARFIDLLLNSGADPNYWEETMQLESALNTAISNQNRRVVELLLFRGANPNKTMSLVAAVPNIGQPIDLEIFRLLLHHKADINPKCLETPPRAAAELRDPTPVTAVDRLRLTPLQTALERSHDELAWMFLDAGADFKAPASWMGGKTALQAAAMNGNMSFIRHFVSRGVDINAPPASNCGATALQFAAIQGHYNVVAFLLENGADVNAPGAAVGGRTALQGASEHGRLDIVHLLLENDQEEESLDQRCQDAAVFAERNGHSLIAEILRGWKKT
ncbi:hypothetical protein BHE90_007799 [Fusarium euwallaceae]|uniref:Clr5 domain-containing protein n=1 Tax=Fusarium euwallaceae TaxID=1147111 RepID=A0A430LPW9_9HYPO|nr:hypothetical protein BHE90_007799 [Fusarium euwallaceae]